MADTQRCLWHKCGREFVPARRSQHFCSPKCQKARATWKQFRGAALVDPLLEQDTAKLAELRAQILEEIHSAT